MQRERPVNINLSPTAFRWPVTAIASILHRLTGAVLFVAIAFLLYLLQVALPSEQGFAEALALLEGTSAKLLLWATLALVIYHLVAGIKHLLLDLHIGDTFEAASAASWAVIVISAVLIALTGAWIW